MPSLRPVTGSADELLGLLRAWDAADDPEPLVVRTSGSTGRPSSVVLSRAAMRASAEATHARLGGPGRWWLTVPPTHIAGLQVLYRSVRSGPSPVLGPVSGLGVEPDDAWPAYLSLVPTQLVRALSDPEQLRALRGFRAVLVGGGPLRAAHRAAAEREGVQVVQSYGMSETCGGCVYDGVPLDGVAVKIDSDGQVLVSGPMLFDGYADDPARTAQVLRGGWLRTADLGELDADGRLSILGRVDDVVISGGVKVSPVAVQEQLAAHPAVLDVAVCGVPDPEWGERVVAVVAGRHDAPVPSLAELRDLVRPRSWAPRQLVAAPAGLPRLSNGKLDRQAVRVLAGGS